jgi:hypothetical protein
MAIFARMFNNGASGHISFKPDKVGNTLFQYMLAVMTGEKHFKNLTSQIIIRDIHESILFYFNSTPPNSSLTVYKR